MSFRFTEQGIVSELGGNEIPFKNILSAGFYHRPEKKFRTGTEFEAHIRIRMEKHIELDLFDPEHGVMIPTRMEIRENTLRVSIDAGAIIESDSNTWRLMELSVLPDLLRSKTTEHGAYLLPNYCGMLTSFGKAEHITNRDRVYMQQSEWEKFGLINAFGALYSDGAVLGIVHTGDFRAWVQTEMNFQPGENRQCTVFGIRAKPSDFAEQETKEIVFKTLPGAKDFTAMAFAYRDYLLEERNLHPLRERMKNNPVLEYAVRAMRVKIFMGQKTPFVADGKSPYANCTTFAEAETILDAMQAAGIRKAIVTLVGWNLGGHDGAYPTHFPVNPEAGGEEGLRSLIRKALSLGYQIVPHDGVCALYMGSPDFDSAYVSRDEFGEPQACGMWAGGLLYIGCPQVYMNRYGGEFKRIRELGFQGCYYIDGLANGLFRCSDPSHPADEKEFARGQLRILGFARMQYGASSTENPALYSLEFIDEAAHLQGFTTWSVFKCVVPESLQKLQPHTVPFYNLAVHGIITYQTEWGHGLRRYGLIPGILRQYAEGARPAIEVSMRGLCNGDYYEDSIRDIRESYRIAFELIPEVHEAFIENYEPCGEKAVRITYDNGIIVSVNHGETAVGGMEALSMKIEKAGKIVYNRKFTI